MYEKFYHLKEKPFNIVPNPSYLYLSEKHNKALTYLEYGLTEGTGFILLTGEIGTGKTTLIRHILNQIESDIEAAVVFNTNITSDEFLALILKEFELAPEKNKADALESLYRFLINRFAHGKRILLIIDEAQNLSEDVLEEVRMLSNLQSDDRILLQIMLVGQPELKAKLKSPNLAQLAQRIIANYHLSPLTRDETGLYITYRLKKAEGDPDLFDPDAVDIIYEVSGGTPRIINLICDAALVYGFADEIDIISAEIVKQVVQDNGQIGFSLERQVSKEMTADEGKETENQILHRLHALEGDILELKIQVNHKVGELEQRADGFKDELVGNLKKLLFIERRRSDKLLQKYSFLKEKFVFLKKNNHGYDVEKKKKSISLESHGKNNDKKGLLKNLFSKYL